MVHIIQRKFQPLLVFITNVNLTISINHFANILFAEKELFINVIKISY